MTTITIGDVTPKKPSKPQSVEMDAATELVRVGAARKVSTIAARKVSSWFLVSSVPCFRFWLMAGCRFRCS